MHIITLGVVLCNLQNGRSPQLIDSTKRDALFSHKSYLRRFLWWLQLEQSRGFSLEEETYIREFNIEKGNIGVV